MNLLCAGWGKLSASPGRTGGAHGIDAGAGYGAIYSYAAPSGGYAANGDILQHADSVMGTWCFIYDAVDRLGGTQVTELNGSGTWQHSNVFSGGRLTVSYDSKGIHYDLADPLGTKRVQANAQGQVDENCFSLPFGNDMNNPLTATCNAPANTLQTNSDATEHHFTQKERDTESGNDYMFARYYSSALGRFLSPDWSAKVEPVPYAKLGDPQTLNLYGYLRNNPLGGVDADGHCGKGPNDPPCNGVKVKAEVVRQPTLQKNVEIVDKNGNHIKATGEMGQINKTVTDASGKPLPGVAATETNKQTATIDGQTVSSKLVEGTSVSNNEGKIGDQVGLMYPTDGTAKKNSLLAQEFANSKVNVTDTQTETLTLPGGAVCTSTSTRVLTNIGSDGNPSSTYTLTTTQPVVTNPQPQQ